MSPPRAPAHPAVRLRRVQADGYLDLAGVHALIERRVAGLFAEQGLVGITPQQSNVLLLLFQEKRPMTAREIARSLEVSEVTVGRFIKALEQNGWIERRPCPDDARAMFVEPTLTARRAFPLFCSVSNALLDEAFRGFEPEEIERQAAFLHRVRTNLGGA
jgi:MarR family transcriptional regulator for hemolysin